jgi:glutathione S-transferase
MKLYYSPVACSLAPHIVLHESGLPFESVLVDLKAHQLPDGSDFYKLNPKGYVPLLQLDNGECLTEGPAIMQYIADLVPAKNLAPANGTMARYRLQEWLNFITSELHKGIGGLFNPAMPEAGKVVMRAKAMDKLTWVNGQLENKEYLMGQFSIADAYLFVVANWTRKVGMDTSALNNIVALHSRMIARASVEAALQSEGIVT